VGLFGQEVISGNHRTLQMTPNAYYELL